MHAQLMSLRQIVGVIRFNKLGLRFKTWKRNSRLGVKSMVLAIQGLQGLLAHRGTRSGKRKVQGESSIDPGETSTKALKAVGTGLALGAPPTGKNASFEVEKVLDARADKHGKLIEAKVSWAPTWEPAKNLTEVTVKEAYSLLFG